MERRSGASSRAALQVGSDAFVDHDGAAGRAALSSVFPLDKTERTLPDGYTVVLKRLIRRGTIGWKSVRTVVMDQQLCGANQQTGTLRLRPYGAGAGLPERSVPVTIQTTLTITNDGPCEWSVTVKAAGPLTEGDQVDLDEPEDDEPEDDEPEDEEPDEV